MESVSEFLQIPLVQIIGWGLGAIGWVIGIHSWILQWTGHLQQQQDRAPFRFLLDQVQRDWKGQYTEEQIGRLTSQFTLLEKQIRDQIPVQARQVFLKNQIATLDDTIGGLFQQYLSTKRELEVMGESSQLDPSIQKEIEREIVPAYVKQLNRQRLFIWLILTILVLMLVPISPVRIMLDYVIMPLLSYLDDHTFLRGYLAIFVLSMSLALLFPIGSLQSRIQQRGTVLLWVSLASALLAVTLVLAFFSGLIYSDNTIVQVFVLVFPVAVVPVAARIAMIVLPQRAGKVMSRLRLRLFKSSRRSQ